MDFKENQPKISESLQFSTGFHNNLSQICR